MAAKFIVSKPLRRFLTLTLRKEQLYPWVWAVLLGLTTFLCINKFGICVTKASLVNALQASVIFGSIAAGLIGTSLVVMTGTNKKFKSKLIRSDYINVLQNYLKCGLYSGFMLALVGIVGQIFVDFSFHQYVTVVWVSVLTFCVLALYRVCNLIFIIFSIPDTH